MRGLENPYAPLQVEEEWRAEYARSENPYALHYYLDQAEPGLGVQITTSAPPPPAEPKSLSKNGFQRGCRDIFVRYIPELEKGRLRDHHRAFIARHEDRAGPARYALLAELKRYDLSDLPGLHSQFNREDEAFTEAKLLEIERNVLGQG